MSPTSCIYLLSVHYNSRQDIIHNLPLHILTINTLQLPSGRTSHTSSAYSYYQYTTTPVRTHFTLFLFIFLLSILYNSRQDTLHTLPLHILTITTLQPPSGHTLHSSSAYSYYQYTTTPIRTHFTHFLYIFVLSIHYNSRQDTLHTLPLHILIINTLQLPSGHTSHTSSAYSYYQYTTTPVRIHFTLFLYKFVQQIHYNSRQDTLHTLPLHILTINKLQLPSGHTSYTYITLDIFGSQGSRERFLCILHKEYKGLRASAWSGWLSRDFNNTKI